jgi:hypothetical protein
MKKTNFILVIALLAITVLSCKKSEPTNDLSIITTPPFTGIKIKGNANVDIRQGAFLVKASSAGEAASLIWSVNNGILEIGANASVIIQAPNLTYIEVLENGTINTQNSFNFLENMSIVTKGDANFYINGSLASGKKLNLVASGDSDFEPQNGSFFSCDEADVTALNNSDVYLKVNNKLNVKVTDDADMYYKGTPLITKQVTLNGQLFFVP